MFTCVHLSEIVSWVRIEDHLLDTPGVTVKHNYHIRHDVMMTSPEGLRCLVIMSRSLWRLIWSLSLCLESLVTEEPRDIGCLDTRGEGGGAIGVVTEPDLLEEELMMGSRDSHLDDNIVICNRDIKCL